MLDTCVSKTIVVYQALVHAVKSISKINYDAPPTRLEMTKLPRRN
jgi:hypothetical protein